MNTITKHGFLIRSILKERPSLNYRELKQAFVNKLEKSGDLEMERDLFDFCISNMNGSLPDSRDDFIDLANKHKLCQIFPIN